MRARIKKGLWDAVRGELPLDFFFLRYGTGDGTWALCVGLAREPRLELVQCLPAVRDLVLLDLFHLRVRRTLVLEA